MTDKLLTVQHLEFPSLKGGCTGWSESTFVKMPHCWKSHGGLFRGISMIVYKLKMCIGDAGLEQSLVLFSIMRSYLWACA